MANTPQEKDKTVKNILAAAEKQIIFLLSEKKTGKFELTLELHLSQGGLGKAFIRNYDRESIF